MERGGSDLPTLPWLKEGQPHDVLTLIRMAVWRSDQNQGGDGVAEELRAALALLTAARAEMDQLEAGLLFVARCEGLEWADVAAAMGLNSRQGAQQRLERLQQRSSGRNS